MRASRVARLVATAVLAAACSTMSPAQDRSFDEVRAFADETARRYGLLPIHVLVSHDPDSPVGSYRRGFFAVNRLVLGSEFRDAIVAHELAHYVLGHDAPLVGGTGDARRREVEQRELDANAKAVEILVRVKGLSERQALTMMLVRRRGLMASQQRGSPITPGHRPAAEEIADLRARYSGVDLELPAPRPLDPIPASTAEPIQAPAWKPGDQWTFWSVSPTVSSTFVWTVDREERVDGQDDYVVRLGTQREFFVRKSDLAVHLEKTSGEVQVRYTPADARYPWPMAVGAERKETFTREQTKPATTEARTQTCRVEAEESVPTQAGTFRAFKVTCRDAKNEPTLHAWYSPEVKNWVRDWRPVKDGALERELISYILR
jgi:hypothetical protein